MTPGQKQRWSDFCLGIVAGCTLTVLGVILVVTLTR